MAGRANAGRADLLRALAVGGEPGLAAMAGQLGWREQVAPATEPTRPTRPPRPDDEIEPPPDPNTLPWAPVPQWQVVGYEAHDPLPRTDPATREREAALPLWRHPPAPPKPEPGPDRQAVSALLAQVWAAAPGGRLDAPRLVARLARAQRPDPMPRKLRRSRTSLVLVVDRSRQLSPFYDWQGRWLDALLQARVPGLQLAIATQGEAPRLIDQHTGLRRRWRDLTPGAPVLLLGDAGTEGEATDRRRWARFARALQRCGCRPMLLCPWRMGVGEAPGWQRLWLGRGGGQRDGISSSAAADQLRSLAALSVRLEPGLALALASLCGASPRLAARLWRDPGLASGSSVAASFGTDARKDAREAAAELAQRDPALLLVAVESIRRWRGELAPVRFEELLELPAGARECLQENTNLQDDVEDAYRYVRQLGEGRDTLREESVAFLRRAIARGLSSAGLPRAEADAVNRLVEAVSAPDAALPEDYRPPNPPGGEAHWCTVSVATSGNRRWLLADHHALDFVPGGTALAQALESVEASVVIERVARPIAQLKTGRETLVLAWSETSRAFGDDHTAELPVTDRFQLRSDRETLHLQCLTRPDWADAFGADRHGLWAEIAIRPEAGGPPVRQRLRWIAPGRFWMGSPEDEPGRHDNEGPRHLVTLSEGYWLFDTPVTQALWTAVMGENPSNFKSPDRPVEQISYDDVERFLNTINERHPGLDLALPSEAQWEYACRAGTDTTTWAGAMEILGENNAPVLEEIAWYGGNSGVDFELDNGYDSTEWDEKAHDHRLAGTHAVAHKQANPWGLYDMLGNVDEWCRDDWRDYRSEAETDPVGSLDSGDRAVRGGSWSFSARAARAACRDRGPRRYAVINLGFRCLRVQGPGREQDQLAPGRAGAGRASRSSQTSDQAARREKRR